MNPANNNTSYAPNTSLRPPMENRTARDPFASSVGGSAVSGQVVSSQSYPPGVDKEHPVAEPYRPAGGVRYEHPFSLWQLLPYAYFWISEPFRSISFYDKLTN